MTSQQFVNQTECILPHPNRKPILAGTRFGRLVVIGRGEPSVRPNGRLSERSSCVCDCGQNAVILNSQLRSNKTKSCGCLQRDNTSAASITHGHTRGHKLSPEYHAWASMWSRVRDSTKHAYHRYGGRGISVCDAWKDFTVFLSDMGQRPSPLHSLDRKDNDGNYEPGNCRWATRHEQMNNVRHNRRITIDAITMTSPQWSRESGVSAATIRERLNRGWSERDAVWTPIGMRSKYGTEKPLGSSE